MSLTVTPTAEMKTLAVGDEIYEVVDDEARTDITEIKADLGDLLEYPIYPWESGAFITASGRNTEDASMIRCQTFFSSDSENAIMCSSDYEFMLYAYLKSDESYVGNYKTDGQFNTSTSNYNWVKKFYFNTFPTYKFKVVLRKTSHATDITSDDGDNCIIIKQTDSSMSLAGKAADAKSVGELIESPRIICDGAFAVPTMGEIYENYEISAAGNSYQLFPSTGTPEMTRARIKQEYIQKIPDGATSCTVVLGEDIFCDGKYKVGFAFYLSNYQQRRNSVQGWFSSPTTFTAAVGENDVYYMLYIANSGSASQVTLSDLENMQCSVIFDNDRANYLHRERMAQQNMFAVDDMTEDIEENAGKISTLMSSVKVINHRGFNTVAPENTLPAFELSAKYGFKYVETDVLFTAPDADNLLGVPVLLHDASINRTARNADGTTIENTINIDDITYAEALNYVYCGSKYSEYPTVKIPTFEEFIKLCKKYGLHPYIELKNEKTYSQDEIDLILSIITNYGMKKNVSFISYDSDALTLVKNRWDWVELGLNTASGGVSTFESLMTGSNEVFATHGQNVSIPDIITAGIPACPYTVDTIADLQALDPYYSYILTDVLTNKEIQDNMFASI